MEPLLFVPLVFPSGGGWSYTSTSNYASMTWYTKFWETSSVRTVGIMQGVVLTPGYIIRS